LLVKPDRFAALFDHRLQHPLDLGLGDALGITLSAHSDVAILEPGQDQASGREGARISGLQRLFQPIGEGLTQHRHIPPSERTAKPSAFRGPRQFCTSSTKYLKEWEVQTSTGLTPRTQEGIR